MSNKKVLIVGAFPSEHTKIFGGIVTDCRILLNSDIHNKLEVTLLDTTQISNPPPIFLVRLFLAINRMLKFFILIINKKPDMLWIFASNGWSMLEKSAMVWFAYLLKIPSMIFPRSKPPQIKHEYKFFKKIIFKCLYGGAARIICQGEAWQKFAINTLGFIKKNAPIVYNWVATKELIEIGSNRIFINKNNINLLFVGWIDRKKGIFELLEACQELVKTYPIILNIIGEGKNFKDIQILLKRGELGDIVKLKGWLHGVELVSEFKEADVFVLPSWEEGLPNAMIEAMAARLPIIVSNVGNISSIIRNQRNGLLIPSKDPIALKTGLIKLIENSCLRRDLANSAFRKAKKDFTVNSAIEILNQIAEEMLAEIN